MLTFICGGSVALFAWTFQAIKGKNEQASFVLSDIQDKMVSKEGMSAVVKKASDLAAIQKNVRSHFIDTNDIAGFVDYLESIGADAGVTLDVQSVDIAPSDKTKVSVHISVKGRYEGIMKTINLLENSPYYVHVTQALVSKSVSTGVDSTGKPKISTNGSWEGEISFVTISLP